MPFLSTVYYSTLLYISGDELFNDAFPIKKVNDFIWEVDGKRINVSEGIDESLIGANPSAEEQEEALNDGVVTEIDVVYSNQLVQTSFPDKKAYGAYLKTYLKELADRVKSKNPDRVKDFQDAVQKYFSANVLGKFSQMQFYTSSSYSDGTQYIIPCNYRDDDITPYFIFIVDGLEEEKC